MIQFGQGLLANVAQGGNCQAVLVDGELRRLAEAAVDCLQMNYAGVDLMRDADGLGVLVPPARLAARAAFPDRPVRVGGVDLPYPVIVAAGLVKGIVIMA